MKKYPADSTPLLTLKSKMDKVNIRPAYQRNFVWDMKAEQELIDTILRDEYIPEIVIGLLRNNPKYEYEVLDGQQRVTTIMRFMDDKFKTKDNTVIKEIDASNKLYSDLHPSIKNIVDAYNLNIVHLEGTTEEYERMYRKLQGGTTLKKAEIRYSYSGPIKDFVLEMLQHPFFTDSVSINAKSNKRKKFNEACEQLLVLETNGVSSIKNEYIQKLYDKYNNTGFDDKLKENIFTKLDFMFNAFPTKASAILSNKTNLVNIFILTGKFMDEFEDYQNYAEDFGRWYRMFDGNRKIQYKLPVEERDELYQKYLSLSSSGTGDEINIRNRCEVLYEDWKKELKEIKDFDQQAQKNMGRTQEDSVVQIQASL